MKTKRGLYAWAKRHHGKDNEGLLTPRKFRRLRKAMMESFVYTPIVVQQTIEENNTKAKYIRVLGDPELTIFGRFVDTSKSGAYCITGKQTIWFYEPIGKRRRGGLKPGSIIISMGPVYPSEGVTKTTRLKRTKHHARKRKSHKAV